MLTAEGLGVELGGRRILSGIALSVARGGWLCLVGPNGAGKSTLLRAITGLVPHEGSVTFDGSPRPLSDRRAAARLVAYVPQRPVLPGTMTVADYVLLGRTPYQSLLGGEGPRDRVVVSEAIERLELGALAGRTLGTLSGGEGQRAVLARAFAQQAPVLVLDEPTSSLDLGHSQRFLELADLLRHERALCVVSALHDLSLAAQYADEVLLLDGGEAIGCGRPAEILTEEAISERFGARVAVSDGPDGWAVRPVRPPRG
ncbi:MAG TPA: ABC transporter ATP-binding protein [Acidimicrobiales bacterium]|nr:ABC transporter ATP-binding protein [Acidimicrobiales bacterium]